jgi:hypothetical protein
LNFELWEKMRHALIESEVGDVVEIEIEDAPVCRICLSSDREDNLIAPCLCKGTQRVVHRKCLDEWRAQESRPRAFTHCPTCKFQYVTDLMIETTSDMRWAYIQYRFLVARDMGAFFILLQLLLCGLAKFIHWCDPSESIANMYPTEWAEKHATTFSIGPYYCTAVLIFLAVAGFIGFMLWCNQDGNSCPCICELCRDTGGINAGIMIMIILAAMVVMGIVVAIFFGGVVVQSLLQRHMHLIARRQEARRVVVRDLSDCPELLRSLSRPRDV